MCYKCIDVHRLGLELSLRRTGRQFFRVKTVSARNNSEITQTLIENLDSGMGFVMVWFKLVLGTPVSWTAWIQIQLAANTPCRQRVVAKVLGSLTHLGALNGVPDSWLQPSQALVVGPLWQ